jgi:hypothetical protein
MVRSCFLAPLAAVLAGFLMVTAGCSGSSLTFSDAVEGTLLLDGAPLPGALIEFVPDVPQGTKAPSSSGVTDEKGYFRLTRSDNHRPGAVVGNHHVVILPGRQAVDRDDPNAQDRAAASQVPNAYMTVKSPLVVEVSKEPRAYELRISRPGGKR